MKKTIRKKVGSLSLSYWDGEKLADLINFLKEFEDPEVLEIDYDYNENYADIIHTREETDEEYQERLNKQLEDSKLYLLHQEKLERAELERLKKKYENKI